LKKTNVIEQDSAAILAVVDFSQLENKTILITGASGLLGVYFLTCLKIVSEKVNGIQIVAVFRSELPNYMAESDFSNLSIFKGDISDSAFCLSLPAVDFIIHAAGYGQPLKFMDAPVKTLQLNTFSTFLLFDKLKPNGHFMFISSSEVYSGLKASIYTEEQIGSTNTTHPRACYIEGKRGGEAICNAYRLQGVKASSVRLAHTYGPGTKKGDKRVILSFIEKALKGEITMMDKGEAVRTYCYISDAIEIMWHILFSCKEPVYNLCGRSQTSIAGVAETIGRIMQVPVVTPEKDNSVAGAPADVQLEMAKVKNEFGKDSYINLEDGLSKTINWYKNIID
jgi:nucleoside-diphosphate-sugar epimerase